MAYLLVSFRLPCAGPPHVGTVVFLYRQELQEASATVRLLVVKGD